MDDFKLSRDLPTVKSVEESSGHQLDAMAHLYGIDRSITKYPFTANGERKLRDDIKRSIQAMVSTTCIDIETRNNILFGNWSSKVEPTPKGIETNLAEIHRQFALHTHNTADKSLTGCVKITDCLKPKGVNANMKTKYSRGKELKPYQLQIGKPVFAQGNDKTNPNTPYYIVDIRREEGLVTMQTLSSYCKSVFLDKSDLIKVGIEEVNFFVANTRRVEAKRIKKSPSERSRKLVFVYAGEDKQTFTVTGLEYLTFGEDSVHYDARTKVTKGYETQQVSKSGEVPTKELLYVDVVSRTGSVERHHYVNGKRTRIESFLD